MMAGDVAQLHLGSAYGRDLIASCLSCPAHESGLFCRLGAAATADLEATRQSTIHPKGAVLFSAGQSPRGIFVVCSGRAKLTINSRRGHSVILGIVGDGDVLGLDAVLSNTPYQVGVETLCPCEVNFIPRAQLRRLLEQHPEMQARVGEYLSLELRRTRAQAARIALARTVRGRLAGLLVDLSGTGRRDVDGIRFQLGLTHEELAALAGTSRETVTRLLNEFRRQGLMRARQGSFIIPDLSRLAALEG
jgi:CRP/FNR family transcriptional regulator, cyclic AMP receptor protein